MLEGVHVLLVDLDGVLYVEEEPIPGGVEAIERLRRSGLTLRFVTNTTAHSRARTLEKLARLGFDVGERRARPRPLPLRSPTAGSAATRTLLW